MAEYELSIGYKVILLAQNLEKVDERISSFTQNAIDTSLDQLENETEKAQKKQRELLESQEKLSTWQSAQKVTSIATSTISLLAVPFIYAQASLASIIGLALSGVINIANELLNLFDCYQTIGSWFTSNPKEAKEYGETIHNCVTAICFFASVASSASYAYNYFFPSDIPPVQNLAGNPSIQATLTTSISDKLKTIISFAKIASEIANISTGVGSVYYANKTAKVQSEKKKIEHHLNRLNQGYEQNLEKSINQLKSSVSTRQSMHFATDVNLQNIKLINQSA